MIPSFPKIMQLGDRNLEGLFDGEIEVTEKIDGSQFSFGVVDGTFYAKTKNSVIATNENMDIPKLFNNSVPLLKRAREYLLDNNIDDMIFSGEFLNAPKHNILTYDSVPKGHFACFAAGKKNLGAWTYTPPTDVEAILTALEVDRVGVLHRGVLSPTKEYFDSLLALKSQLGGPNIEGFVVKNYAKSVMIGHIVMPIMAGKYVSEAFKEKHIKDWVPGEDIVTKIVNEVTGPARWNKAIQKLKEADRWTGSVKDIGPLIGIINADLREEEEYTIRDMLFKHFWKNIHNKAVHGFPEWYKQYLLQTVVERDDEQEIT